MAPRDFVDLALARRIGHPTGDIAAAIDAECRGALRSIVGPHLQEGCDPVEVAPCVAPWIFDLGRGLHWHALRGPAPTSNTLIATFGADDLALEYRLRHARTVDTAAALHHGRLTEQIFGPGSLEVASVILRDRHPWFDATVVGFRIGIALELIRLLAQSPDSGT